MFMVIFAQEVDQGTLDTAVDNISTGAPYVAIFGLIVALVRIIVKRSDAAEISAKEHVAAAEARMVAEIARITKEYRETCHIHVESVKNEYEAHVTEVKAKLELLQRGMDILAAQYPDNETLKFMLSTMKSN